MIEEDEVTRTISDEDIEICNLNPTKHILKSEILDFIYSTGTSDRWYCLNCNDHGDKWYMMVHNCKFRRKQIIKEQKKEEDNDPNQDTLD